MLYPGLVAGRSFISGNVDLPVDLIQRWIYYLDMTGYRLIKYAGDKFNSGNGGNVIVDSFAHYSTAMAALRKTDSSHFVQGPRRAFWFDESKPQTQALPESNYLDIVPMLMAGISIETIQ